MATRGPISHFRVYLGSHQLAVPISFEQTDE